MKKKLRHSTCDEVDGYKGGIILSLLDKAFAKATCIDEVGTLMLPEPSTENARSESAWEEHVKLVDDGHVQKLGIGMHCMKPLFAHTVTRLGSAIKAFRADPGMQKNAES